MGRKAACFWTRLALVVGVLLAAFLMLIFSTVPAQ